MQQKLNILSEIISKSSLSFKQKKLCADIIIEVINKFNQLSNLYYKRTSKDYKLKQNDFIDYFDKIYSLFLIMDLKEVDIDNLNWKHINWLYEHIDEVKQQLTSSAIKLLLYYIFLYDCAYDGKLPNDMNELKVFILEPLEIKVDFETDYNNALIEYRNTGEMKEILKLAPYKQAFINLKENKNE